MSVQSEFESLVENAGWTLSPHERRNALTAFAFFRRHCPGRYAQHEDTTVKDPASGEPSPMA
ncbi:MAG: hypothetical protein KDA28_05080, partial [Phycisphaerales bacterium]|nr:hypothetical protein [Phycisphaerales bacterium]